MKQTDCILDHLQAFGTITPADAWRLYGIMRLGARVKELRSRGHLIVTETETALNRYGKTTRYARYKLS